MIREALQGARDTKLFMAEGGIRHRAGEVFSTVFGAQDAVIVADGNTYAAAGRDVEASVSRRGQGRTNSFIFGLDVYADYEHVLELENALRASAAIAVAVGSGTINDLVKLVSGRLNRPYMVVATAASMDGYTAFGASILRNGSKETMDCPAPRAAIADLEVICNAPTGMNASGYADLLAKVVAGADWILADAVGTEPIEDSAWHAVQQHLRSWTASPGEIAQNHPRSTAFLIQGLIMSGLAMQLVQSSRPASGAEHYFSHLWDMQHHTFQGVAPSHGFKVGIGTLASLALWEEILRRDFRGFDVESAVGAWPSLEAHEERIRELFGSGGLADRALGETRAKYTCGEQLRDQLSRVRDNWPEIRSKIQAQLMAFGEVRQMLRKAGCPFEPEQIGISRARLRRAYEQCCYLRRRFTILDFVHRAGLLDPSVESLFGSGGCWEEKGEGAE